MVEEIVNMAGGGIHAALVSDNNRCSLRRHSELEIRGGDAGREPGERSKRANHEQGGAAVANRQAEREPMDRENRRDAGRVTPHCDGRLIDYRGYGSVRMSMRWSQRMELRKAKNGRHPKID